MLKQTSLSLRGILHSRNGLRAIALGALIACQALVARQALATEHHFPDNEDVSFEVHNFSKWATISPALVVVSEINKKPFFDIGRDINDELKVFLKTGNTKPLERRYRQVHGEAEAYFLTLGEVSPNSFRFFRVPNDYTLNLGKAQVIQRIGFIARVPELKNVFAVSDYKVPDLAPGGGFSQDLIKLYQYDEEAKIVKPYISAGSDGFDPESFGLTRVTRTEK